MFPSTPSVYPVFVADQVLTAHDLNESFNYLDEQERITRTNLIGIGIVCGLQVQYNAATNEITITKGCGITSKGYLISVDEKKYTKVVAYSNQLNDKTYDGWFVNPGTPPTPKITLWELKQASDDPAAVNITQAFLADPGKEKIVLLYVELLDVKNKNCDPNSCDDKGTHYEITFRPLLVEKNDALTLIGASGGTVTMDTFNALAELKMRRFDVPNTNPVSSQDIFDAYSAVLNNGFLAATENALTQAYTAFQVFVTSEFPVNPFSGLAANFAAANNGSLTTNQLIHIQYIYDLFSDFLLAYEEFRKTGMQILSACCPSKDLFPQHLLLGEAIPLAANIKSSFRHYFIYSPLFEKKNLLPELKSLFRRLVLLKEKFFIPPVSSGSPNSATDPNIRITPSKLEDIAISQKAIPYYYNVTSGPSPLYKSWNFEKAVRGASQRNLSYHAALYNATDDFVINPLRYDLEPYNFLRIEGIIGKPYAKVLSNVKKLIRTNRLPVDVIALNTENSKLLQGIGSFNNQLGSFNLSGSLSNTDFFSMLCHFQDLEAMYDAMKNEMLCTLCKELKYYYDIRFNFRTKDTATGNEQDVPSVVGLFQSCSPGYIVKKGTFGALIEKVYQQVGDEGAITIQAVADALNIDSFLAVDANGDGIPDNLSQAAVTFMGYVVTLFEIPINIIRLANTFTSNLSSFDVTEYCRLHKLLTEKANSLKFVFNMFTASEKQTFRTEAAGASGGAADGGAANSGENITTGAFTLLRSVTTKNSTVGLLLLIFLLEDFFDHLDVLIYNCKCSAFKAMKAEYLKRAAYLTLLKQFGYFTKLHPGIQHKAGVPMGGTFIIVYHSRESRLITGSAKGRFFINGVVVDENGAVLPGVNILVLNSTKATVTNADGRFQLMVNELPVTLRVTFLGFDVKEVVVNSEEQLTIALGDDNTETQENAIDSIPEGTVIADFYLPYRCCSDCPPIQYVVKEPGDNLPGNKAPIAVAGEDQQITLPRDTVTLDGNASTDPDGAITMYSWAKLSGPGQPEIVTANSARTTIKDLQEGRYQFELTVVDDKGLIGKDQVIVDVFPAPPLNQPPVVDAGVDQTIVFSFVAGNFVTLSGTATDPEGGPLVLLWKKDSGPGTPSIIAANSLTTPVTGLVPGDYVFSLTATDNQQLSATDTMKVTVAPPPNRAPVAVIGTVAPITLPVNVINLNGSSSSDPDNDPLTFDWQMTTGPVGAAAPQIANPAAAQTQVTGLVPGTYVFTLTVNDGRGGTATANVNVVVNPAPAIVKVCSEVPKIVSAFTSFPQEDPTNFENFKETFRSYGNEILLMLVKFGVNGINITSLSMNDQVDFFENLKIPSNNAAGGQLNLTIQQALEKWFKELTNLIVVTPNDSPQVAAQKNQLRMLALKLYRILVQLAMHIVCIQRNGFTSGKIPLQPVFKSIDDNIKNWLTNLQPFSTPQRGIVKLIGSDATGEIARVTANGEATAKAAYITALTRIASGINTTIP